MGVKLGVVVFPGKNYLAIGSNILNFGRKEAAVFSKVAHAGQIIISFFIIICQIQPQGLLVGIGIFHGATVRPHNLFQGIVFPTVYAYIALFIGHCIQKTVRGIGINAGFIHPYIH